MNKSRTSHIIILFLLLPQFLRAQDEGMSYTVGITHVDDSGQPWAYLLWQATTPEKLAGLRFGIYGKPGDPTSSSPYTKLGETAWSDHPAHLAVHLDNSKHLGADLVLLEDQLDQMFEGLVEDNHPLTPEEKLSVVLQGARNDSELYNRMLFMGRGHPGINLAMGLAWTEPLGGLTTYELRILDPVTGEDGRVLGRVSLDPANPAPPLPAPENLFEVMRNSGKGHLNVALRWVVPDDLRRLSPLQHGFNLYRMTRDFAEAQFFHINPPPAETLVLLAASGGDEVVRVNNAPVLAVGDYSASNVTSSEDDTSFIVDDNQRFFGGMPFQACSEYYYFASARDVLGNDGLVSEGLYVSICDRLPPDRPRGLTVTNDYRFLGGNGDQRLLLTWQQNDAANTDDRAAAYYVYRWETPDQYLAHTNDPGFNLIAGPIDHEPGLQTISYRDDGTGAPHMPANANTTYWYTVRAIDEGNCTTCTANYSGHSSPVYGVLRDREGPSGPTGTIDIQCATMTTNPNGQVQAFFASLGLPEDDPSMGFIPDLRDQVKAEDDCPERGVTISQELAPYTPVTPGNYTLTLTASDFSGNSVSCMTDVDVEGGRGSRYVYVFRAERQQAGPIWAEFYLNNPDTGFLARINFPEDAAHVDYYYHLSVDQDPDFSVYCRMGSSEGVPSNDAFQQVTEAPPPNTALLVRFQGVAGTTERKLGTCDGPHVAVDTASGEIYPISIAIHTTPTTRQWKLYRRVDGGEFTLLAVGESEYPQGGEWKDNTMPINATRICYFAQLFDEHGNASPMVRLGCTRTTGSGSLPTPTLVALSAQGDEKDPSMKIRWFSESESVERFSLWISSEPAALPAPFTRNLSPDTAPTPNWSTAELPGGSSRKNFRVYNTARVGGPDFAAVPPFDITVPVETGQTYTVFITARNPNNGSGPASNARQFLWSAREAAQDPLNGELPWPAREEPQISSSGFERVSARQLLLNNGFRGLGVRVGEVWIRGLHCLEGSEQSPFFTPENKNPLSHLYHSSTNGQNLASFILYRYQVPNVNFPKVSGDVTQVSPLLEQVAFHFGTSPQFGVYGALIDDPFFAVLPVNEDFQSSPCFEALPDLREQYEFDDCSGVKSIEQSPEPGTLLGLGSHQVTITATDVLGNTTEVQSTYRIQPPPDPDPIPYEIFALDTQPVIIGARYRYLLVRFGNNGEASQVIPVSEIDVEPAL